MSNLTCTCGAILNHIDEPCPECLPSMAWRPSTKVCQECITLRKRVEELEEQVADYCNDAETWKDLYQKECIEINVVGSNEAKKIADYVNKELQKKVEELERANTQWDRDYRALVIREDRYLKALERIIPMIGTLRSSLKHWGIPKDAKGLCSQIKNIATDAIREGKHKFVQNSNDL